MTFAITRNQAELFLTRKAWLASMHHETKQAMAVATMPPRNVHPELFQVEKIDFCDLFKKWGL